MASVGAAAMIAKDAARRPISLVKHEDAEAVPPGLVIAHCSLIEHALENVV
jgi:hypothetical protein